MREQSASRARVQPQQPRLIHLKQIGKLCKRRRRAAHPQLQHAFIELHFAQMHLRKVAADGEHCRELAEGKALRREDQGTNGRPLGQQVGLRIAMELLKAAFERAFERVVGTVELGGIVAKRVSRRLTTHRRRSGRHRPR